VAFDGRRFDRTQDLLREANMPGVHRYASRIMEAIDKDIHWYRPVDSIAAVPAPLVKATRRMPGRSVEMAIYKRDSSRMREIRMREDSGAFRVIYLATVADTVLVLHAFQKKTQQTAQHDIDLAANRLKEWRG